MTDTEPRTLTPEGWANLTDEQAIERFRRHVAFGRSGWADPLLQGALERVLALVEARATPGLDVERLARAMHGFNGHRDHHADFRGCAYCSPIARGIAAEYDRLTTQEPDHD